MTEDKKKEFINRINSANRMQMLIVVFDMIIEYMNNAIGELKEERILEAGDEISAANKGIDLLIESLDFDQPISERLFELYVYVKKQMLLGKLRHDTENVLNAFNVIKELRESFNQISDQDKSGPLLESTRHVEVGITYGKGTLNESLINPEGNHSFSV